MPTYMAVKSVTSDKDSGILPENWLAERKLHDSPKER